MGFFDFFKRVGDFASSVWGGIKTIGSKISEGFNTFKNFARPVLDTVRSVAGSVRDATSLFNDIPVIGEVSRTIGQVANVIDKGAGFVQNGIGIGEQWQRSLGYDTSNARLAGTVAMRPSYPVRVR
jgi:hypothetical protein